MAVGKKEGESVSGGKISKIKEVGSKLDPNIQELIRFIFDKKLMEKSVVSVGYDINKMPLGELSKETVLKGYRIIRDIENVISGKQKGNLTDLSSQFYSNIPHNFGFQKMSNFIIKDSETLKAKMDLIQNLIDIQVAHNIVEKNIKEDGNILDKNYS